MNNSTTDMKSQQIDMNDPEVQNSTILVTKQDSLSNSQREAVIFDSIFQYKVDDSQDPKTVQASQNFQSLYKDQDKEILRVSGVGKKQDADGLNDISPGYCQASINMNPKEQSEDKNIIFESKVEWRSVSLPPTIKEDPDEYEYKNEDNDNHEYIAISEFEWRPKQSPLNNQFDGDQKLTNQQSMLEHHMPNSVNKDEKLDTSRHLLLISPEISNSTRQLDENSKTGEAMPSDYALKKRSKYLEPENPLDAYQRSKRDSNPYLSYEAPTVRIEIEERISSTQKNTNNYQNFNNPESLIDTDIIGQKDFPVHQQIIILQTLPPQKEKSTDIVDLAPPLIVIAAQVQCCACLGLALSHNICGSLYFFATMPCRITFFILSFILSVYDWLYKYLCNPLCFKCCDKDANACTNCRGGVDHSVGSVSHFFQGILGKITNCFGGCCDGMRDGCCHNIIKPFRDFIVYGIVWMFKMPFRIFGFIIGSIWKIAKWPFDKICGNDNCVSSSGDWCCFQINGCAKDCNECWSSICGLADCCRFNCDCEEIHECFHHMYSGS